MRSLRTVSTSYAALTESRRGAFIVWRVRASSLRRSVRGRKHPLPRAPQARPRRGEIADVRLSTGASSVALRADKPRIHVLGVVVVEKTPTSRRTTPDTEDNTIGLEAKVSAGTATLLHRGHPRHRASHLTPFSQRRRATMIVVEKNALHEAPDVGDRPPRDAGVSTTRAGGASRCRPRPATCTVKVYKNFLRAARCSLLGTATNAAPVRAGVRL